MNLGFPATCHPKFFDQVPDKDNYELLSYRQNEKAGLVNTLRMEFFWDAYLDEKDRKPDWRHSPLLSENLGGLPPLSEFPSCFFFFCVCLAGQRLATLLVVL